MVFMERPHIKIVDYIVEIVSLLSVLGAIKMIKINDNHTIFYTETRFLT